MPPAIRFSREAVLEAAYELVRRDGPASLNARAVARELGGSTQPIFRLFTGMDELHQEVINLADAKMRAQMRQRAEASICPYLSVCMSYLLFARDEPQLFKLLFMRDRVKEGIAGPEYKHSWGFSIIEKSMDVDHDTAVKLYERTFFHTHGVAVCFATKYMPCMSEEQMEQLLSDNLKAAAAHLNIPLTVTAPI